MMKIKCKFVVMYITENSKFGYIWATITEHTTSVLL